jgi:formate dehydrogenase iron-sulfur subunit
MSTSLMHNQLSGPHDPAPAAGWVDPPPRKGFFTDTSICIGCKACEVACKEWNMLPMDNLGMTGESYDNTGALGANTWRHVAFVEQGPAQIARARESGRQRVSLGMPTVRSTSSDDGYAAEPAPVEGELPDFRWLMSSDVCKHCTHAACLDVCPTGSLFRTEFGTVVVQDDICNGCGYCVPACPFGVIERRASPDMTGARIAKQEGIAQKCTLCYDRLREDEEPACAKACPTTSIQFGDLDEMRRRAEERARVLHEMGYTEARTYGTDPRDGVGGTGSVFLLLDEPEVYGLPPDPVVTTHYLPDIFRKAGLAGLAMIGAAALSFLGRRS